jgi:Ca2+-transporting ATPase
MTKDDVPEPARAASGLSSAEAATRLRRFGPNELPRTPRRLWFRIIFDVLREPMFLLLVAAALRYLLVGDPAEALLLGAFAVMSVGLVVVQENRSERALEALRQLAAPTARVMRGGQMCRIAVRELVPGDVLLVGEGERIAADGWVIRAEAASVDESLLTGESVPVSKRVRLADDSAPPSPGGDVTAFAYSGSLAVAGHLVIEVARTGVHTATGRIGLSLATIETGADAGDRGADRRQPDAGQGDRHAGGDAARPVLPRPARLLDHRRCREPGAIGEHRHRRTGRAFRLRTPGIAHAARRDRRGRTHGTTG